MILSSEEYISVYLRNEDVNSVSIGRHKCKWTVKHIMENEDIHEESNQLQFEEAYKKGTEFLTNGL